MSDKITYVNGAVLRWARLLCGNLQLKNINDNIEKIYRWENGEDYPTYSQLEELSNAYRKPIALFFFPNPPEGYEIEANFRTMSGDSIKLLSHKVIRLIYEAMAMQINLQELMQNPHNGSSNLQNRLKNLTESQMLNQAREILGVSIDAQIRCRTAKDMLETWRDAFWMQGIYVFKEAFRDSSISGFCIYDYDFPIIYLNNSMSYTRQIFTLFHELYHLCYETGGVDKLHEKTDEALSQYQKQIEKRCNEFAADFLLPTELILKTINKMNVNYDTVCLLAEKFCVSRESVILKLIDLRKLDWDFYNDNIDDINHDFSRLANNKKGGDANRNLISYLGNQYLKLAFTAYRENRIDAFQLATYIKTSANNLSTLENMWGWKG